MGRAIAVIAAGLAVSAPALAAPGDASHGKALFEARCSLCHSVEPGSGEGGMGPPLAGVVDRKAANVSGFTYSKALRASGLTWTPQELDRFLTSPKTLVPGTKMPVATPSAQDRANIIAYLATTKP